VQSAAAVLAVHHGILSAWEKWRLLPGCGGEEDMQELYKYARLRSALLKYAEELRAKGKFASKKEKSLIQNLVVSQLLEGGIYNYIHTVFTGEGNWGEKNDGKKLTREFLEAAGLNCDGLMNLPVEEGVDDAQSEGDGEESEESDDSQLDEESDEEESVLDQEEEDEDEATVGEKGPQHKKQRTE